MNKNSKEVITPLRYERKFILPYDFQFLITKFIAENNLRFVKQYSERLVNSIYYDTYNLDFYKQNIEGLSKRSKFRIRWYGNEKNIKPSLEIKMKDCHLGKKRIFQLQELLIENNKIPFELIDQQIMKNINSFELKELFKKLFPILLTNYQRSYFISNLNQCRLTIDKNIRFSNLSKFYYPLKDHANINNIIIELKYNNEEELEFFIESSNLPVRLTKYSKYVEGINQFKNC